MCAKGERVGHLHSLQEGSAAVAVASGTLINSVFAFHAAAAPPAQKMRVFYPPAPSEFLSTVIISGIRVGVFEVSGSLDTLLG